MWQESHSILIGESPWRSPGESPQSQVRSLKYIQLFQLTLLERYINLLWFCCNFTVVTAMGWVKVPCRPCFLWAVAELGKLFSKINYPYHLAVLSGRHSDSINWNSCMLFGLKFINFSNKDYVCYCRVFEPVQVKILNLGDTSHSEYRLNCLSAQATSSLFYEVIDSYR